MADRKAYMREYMRRRRASRADSADVNGAYIQFAEHFRGVIRQEVDQAIQPLLVQLTKLAAAKLPPDRELSCAEIVERRDELERTQPQVANTMAVNIGNAIWEAVQRALSEVAVTVTDTPLPPVAEVIDTEREIKRVGGLIQKAKNCVPRA